MMGSWINCHLYLLVDEFPPRLTVPLTMKSPLRYGENPHQKAAVYVDKRLAEFNAGGIANAIQHHGKVSIISNCNLCCRFAFQNSICLLF